MESMGTLIVGLVSGGGLTAFVAAYLAIRKQRKQEQAKDTTSMRTGEKTTIGQWREIVADLRVQHNAEVGRLREQHSAAITSLEREVSELHTEADEARQERDECRIQAARQDVELTHLRQTAVRHERDIDELRQILADNGLRSGPYRKVETGSGTHRPLPPDPPQ